MKLWEHICSSDWILKQYYKDGVDDNEYNKPTNPVSQRQNLSSGKCAGVCVLQHSTMT